MRLFLLVLIILFILVNLFSSIIYISGHNWIAHQSRDQFASTQYPFPPKIGNTPHVQISKSQNFTVDWSIGHGKIRYKNKKRKNK